MVKAERQVQKSPAEFFAENQSIAGFDNLGKSLYTTIRELVENALDACETIQILPKIDIHVQEYSQKEFNTLNLNDIRLQKTTSLKNASPISKPHAPIDTELFQKKKGKQTKTTTSPDIDDSEEPSTATTTTTTASNKKTKKKQPQTTTAQYFLITVTDNGCGMDHDAIPNLFGRVLSGSKYGVRQTRGKFGLGAKMALIWAKKSTGQPIHIVTAHRTDPNTIPKTYSSCILDIDIYKNRPRVLEHTQRSNGVSQQKTGTTVRVLIAGNWTTYKSRVVQYLQQLAIITPYAEFSLNYTCSGSNKSNNKKNLEIRYDRRSEQMPPTPVTVQHHPASVNNIIIQQLIQFTRTKTLVNFLSKELSTVSMALAKRLIAELSNATGISETMKPSQLTDKQITRLVQLFHQVQLFRPPDGSCLSPLGEYNLNLGIHKVLQPDFIATTRDKASAYEGHPFLIEAAVSLGGAKIKEGVTVYRFANRIPLLFEGGADVATRVAMTKIRWSSYKIDWKRDKVGVFVSIVSTKIPFKGTSKEYIGDDATEIHQSVKRALQNCCQQLRSHLTKRNALKDAKTRKSRLAKHVPDVGRALFGLLDGMRKRRAEQSHLLAAPPSPTKRLRLDDISASQIVQRLDKREITEERIRNVLMETIDAEHPELDEMDAAVSKSESAVPLYLVPLYNLDDPSNDVHDELFTFRPILPVRSATGP